MCVSHSANGNASLQNHVHNEENGDQSTSSCPDKINTFCTSEGGGCVQILRRTVFSQGRAAALILGRLGFLPISGSPWYDSIPYFSLRTRSSRFSPQLYLTLTFYHWQLAFMQMQLKSYMTAVSLMAPPHNGLDTP
jgi:hypothetical protein